MRPGRRARRPGRAVGTPGGVSTAGRRQAPKPLSSASSPPLKITQSWDRRRPACMTNEAAELGAFADEQDHSKLRPQAYGIPAGRRDAYAFAGRRDAAIPANLLGRMESQREGATPVPSPAGGTPAIPANLLRHLDSQREGATPVPSPAGGTPAIPAIHLRRLESQRHGATPSPSPASGTPSIPANLLGRMGSQRDCATPTPSTGRRDACAPSNSPAASGLLAS